MKMNRILVIFAMVFGAVLGGAIVQQADGQTLQQNIASSSSGQSAGSPQPAYTGAASSPQAAVAVPPQFSYYPTYPEYPDHRYSLQQGYEGYLVAPGPEAQPSTWRNGLWSYVGPVSRYALTYGARAGFYLLNFVMLLVLGTVFTTSVCTFTPICTITLLGLGKAEVKEQVTELARTYMTPERISAATSMVRKAIDKYTALQKQLKGETEETAEEIEETEQKSEQKS